MCSLEEMTLLRLEEAFLAMLAHVGSSILQPLLLAGPEHSEPWARECLCLLQQLHRSSEQLQEVTEQSLQSLQKRLHQPCTAGLESLLMLGSADRILQVYMEYIESYTSCMVVQVFQQVAKRKSRYWRVQFGLLQKHLPGMSFEGPVDAVLAQALRQPLVQHLQQCVLLLLQLRDGLGKSHPAQELVTQAITLYGNLQSFLQQALDQATATQALWHSLSSRLKDALCTPTRRLLQDSQDVPMTATPLRAERVLLFDDALVLLQGPAVHTFDLRLLWVRPRRHECTFCVLTPEEEFSLSARDPLGRAVWQWKVSRAVSQALRGKKDFPVLGAGPAPSEPPACRSVAYTFSAEGRLCQATYEGEWCLARPHGKGTLKWPDGRHHVGNFRWGLEHGFGIYLVPKATEDQFDCYKCHWQEGSMCGYGICEYGSEEVYKGYFRAGLRHGFGVLDSAPQAPQPFRYTGHWEQDQRSGYGVQEDSSRGERYIGEWQANQRHGLGVVVTQAGVCYQGTFQADKMVGPGILLSEDDSMYEGTFTRDLTFEGKGKITFPNGFTLEGSFSSGAGRGLYTQSVLDTAALPPDPSSTHKRQLGVGALPVESRWRGVYTPFWDFAHAGCPGELQEALLGFQVQSSRELRRSQERGSPEDAAGGTEAFLEDLLRPRQPAALRRHLGEALSAAWHPLGKLLRTLMLTFQATYAGIGANKHLQGLAQEEVKQHARELWAAYRGLLQVALQHKGQALEDEDAETSFYSELFTLYLLLHEREDGLYSQGISSLSVFPDTKLLELLDVHKHLWPLKDLRLTSNQRSSLVRDKCFLSATECLQKIITTVDPREKLEVLEKTYLEIEATVSRVLGREHKLPMDDLLPLLVYVVSRARIQHLGAEIHLIRDMMDPVHTGGRYDFLLTALESCYQHIQKEDVRLHRLPGHWDLRDLR
ncbi:ALS2 C-terminal-like protein isoform X2 [Heterocephalus glaber]|uniref:ALS2 C-terminal-like protein isoform X2 n=1 Tax=Heterocephalus glaber TaxID=10181 RepID=A0AAX6SY97_HETGA|nr:ALS2 C-terminal-like protein isoform X2 [Heterocephalus glaber]